MAYDPNRRRGRKALNLWSILSAILSAVFMTVGIFLILMAFAEVLVYGIDSLINGNESYQNWWSTPLLMVLVSVPFFLGYFVVNLNRFAFYHRLRQSLSFNMPREKRRKGEGMDKIELD
jgi:uncharacterized BrkB/YihY/UPF0761 family membrane protein